jgi:uncharacterized protein YecT (DUF1311 family)
MRTATLVIILLGVAGALPVHAGMKMETGRNRSSMNSGIDEEAYRRTEAEMNQLYQQVLKSLTSENRQKMIIDQGEWMKKRDSIVPANPNDPFKEKNSETLARVGVLLMIQKRMQKGDEMNDLINIIRKASANGSENT